MAGADVVCWEVLDGVGEQSETARALYESTLEPDERIPWQWIEEGIAGRPYWRPGQWNSHLALAALREGGRTGAPVGFATGLYIPGYGGYLSYLGVLEQARGHGVGGRLLRHAVRLLTVDAAGDGAALPFVIWESRPPGPEASTAEQAVWEARVRLFAHVGAYAVSGLTFLVPVYSRRGRPPLPMQLFLLPVEADPASFGPEELREAAAGLYREVYGRGAGDRLVRQALPPGCSPALVPARQATGQSPPAPAPATTGLPE